MLSYTGERRERVLASPQHNGKSFQNAGGARPTAGRAFSLIPEIVCKRSSRLPQVPLPVEDPLEVWSRKPSSPLRITWLGHSTLLLESDGLRILTDPVFGNRASPFAHAGIHRMHRVPATLEQLPPLDAVILSHDHYDHLCATSIRKLAAMQVPIVTSLGVGARLEGFGYDPHKIVELDWWEQHVLPGGRATITATPAQHFSGRSLADRNQTLWSSWSIRTDSSHLFFSGDTGLSDHFRAIADRLGPFDVSMLEIGAFHEAWSSMHLGPKNALSAFEMLGGGTLLPIHWSTFDLALHTWEQPAEELLTLAQDRGTRVLTPILGQPTEPSHVDHPTLWWRAFSGPELPAACSCAGVPLAAKV